MDRKDWIILPQETTLKELNEEESYAKLLVLMHEFEEERGHSLTDKQADALKRVVASLIEARARVRSYQDE